MQSYLQQRSMKRPATLQMFAALNLRCPLGMLRRCQYAYAFTLGLPCGSQVGIPVDAYESGGNQEQECVVVVVVYRMYGFSSCWDTIGLRPEE